MINLIANMDKFLSELKNHFPNCYNISEDTDGKIILCTDTPSNTIVSNNETEPKEEKELESSLNSEIKPLSLNSDKPVFGNGDGEPKGYVEKKNIAFVSHIRSGEPCFNKCGLASEWQIEIDPDFKQCFCNGCFDKAKKDLEANGFTVKFAAGLDNSKDYPEKGES